MSIGPPRTANVRLTDKGRGANLALYESGPTKKEVARQVVVHHSTVIRALRKCCLIEKGKSRDRRRSANIPFTLKYFQFCFSGTNLIFCLCVCATLLHSCASSYCLLFVPWPGRNYVVMTKSLQVRNDVMTCVQFRLAAALFCTS
jgi:hypothetical protein